MEERNEGIEGLRKVFLQLEAGSGAQVMDYTSVPLSFEFIYGIGPGGLTPFEYEIVHKRVGESFCLYIRNQDIRAVFEHLNLPPLNVPAGSEGFYLRGTVVRVVPAEQKEVIAAMAEIAGCGGHCCGQ